MPAKVVFLKKMSANLTRKIGEDIFYPHF